MRKEAKRKREVLIYNMIKEKRKKDCCIGGGVF